MKNIVKLLLIVLLITAQSCGEDFLDQVPSTQQSPESITTVADARIVMNGAYELLQENSYYAANMICSNDARADDMQAIDNGRIEDEYLYNYTPDIDFDNTIWGHPYRVVRHVNSILSFIDDIVATDTEITERESIKGQALVIRALAHFDLCRMFGKAYSHDNGASLGVPVVTEVLSPDAKLGRPSVSEVYVQVLADLDEAIPLLQDNDD